MRSSNNILFCFCAILIAKLLFLVERLVREMFLG